MGQNNLAVVDQNLPAVLELPEHSLALGMPTPSEWQMMGVMVEAIKPSPFFSNLGGAPGMLSVMLFCKIIDIPFMVGLMGGVHNIKGRCFIAPQTAAMKIRKAGHSIKIVRADDEACEIHGKRKDTGEEYIATFTIHDAKKAQLVKQDGGYEKNPSDMLFARAMGRLSRRLFIDVVMGAPLLGEEALFEESNQEAPQSSEHRPATIKALMEQKETSIDITPHVDITPVQPPEPVKTEVAPPKTEAAPAQAAPPETAQPSPPEPPKQATEDPVLLERREKQWKMIGKKVCELCGCKPQDFCKILPKADHRLDRGAEIFNRIKGGGITTLEEFSRLYESVKKLYP